MNSSKSQQKHKNTTKTKRGRCPKCPAGICPSMIGGFRQFTIDSSVPVDNDGDDDDDDG